MWLLSLLIGTCLMAPALAVPGPVAVARATAALSNAFVGDALSMPAHWFYSVGDIVRTFSRLTTFQDAPKVHPGAIMSLHSTRAGGRGAQGGPGKEIVGDVILKGRRQFWGGRSNHYHHGMKVRGGGAGGGGGPSPPLPCRRLFAAPSSPRTRRDGTMHCRSRSFIALHTAYRDRRPPPAPVRSYRVPEHPPTPLDHPSGPQAGENTLNLHVARLLMRSLARHSAYVRDAWLQEYIEFMTTEGSHPDTYAESYHRGFFANLEAGKPPHECGAVTHDTASIGGLVTCVPLALRELLATGGDVAAVQATVREHLATTHPDEGLYRVADSFVSLTSALLFRGDDAPPARATIAAHAEALFGLDLPKLVAAVGPDGDDTRVVGGQFSPACYITDSYPSVLFLAFKYHDSPDAALEANANAGGDNCHRGAVLGALVGLSSGRQAALAPQLADARAIGEEVSALLKSVPSLS